MKVVGFGDNVVDKYHHIKTMFPGGNALNVAVYAKMLGHDAAYIGVFGNDDVAEHIKATLRELDIDISQCRTKEGENGYAEVDIVDGERVFFGGNKGGVSKLKPINVTSEDIAYCKQFDLLHSSCYSNMDDQLHKFEALRDTIVSYDFSNKYDNQVLGRVCPYIDVALFSAGHIEDGGEIGALLEKSHNLGCTLSIASLGIRGQMIYDGKDFYTGKVNLVKAIDTLGAGDSFFAQFIISLMEQGYKKNDCLTQEMVTVAAHEAASFSSETCQVMGAFGYGKRF